MKRLISRSLWGGLLGILIQVCLMIFPGWAEQVDSNKLTAPPSLGATPQQNAAILGAEILLLETEEEAIYLPLILKQ